MRRPCCPLASLTADGPFGSSGWRSGALEQQGGPPYMVVVFCEGDEMERRRADTAEERDRLVRELERKYRNCLITVAANG